MRAFANTAKPMAMYLFVDQLTNVDFSFLDVKRGIVGETWLANVGLGGSLDPSGMICDFGAVKSAFRVWLDENLDHRLAVPTRSPALTYTLEQDYIHLQWQSDIGAITMSAPIQAVALIPVTTITPESCVDWVVESVQHCIPEQVSNIDLNFTVETIPGAYYHYTHGLKKHHGNCQRIAHGHRSSIAIWRDGERDNQLERQWAEQWRDVYLASQEDILAQDSEYYTFGYQAPQGTFKLQLPKDRCYLISTETTVENIAAHIHSVLQQNNPNSKIKVKAFEGIGKGAMIGTT